MNNLTVSLSPHIHSRNSITREMWNVIIALIPALAVAIWTFGLPALAVIAVCLATCVLCEWLIVRFLFHRPSTIADGSAIITGLLLAFNLPASIPLWMAAVGSVVAIAIAKMSFGGLGRNIWNPALTGRVFLLISFPAAMTTWPEGVASGVAHISGASAHANSGATLLTTLNAHPGMDLDSVNILNLLTGNMNGSLGEVGSLAIIIGLIYLLATKTIKWQIPVSILASAAFFSFIFGANPLLDLLAGGLMLGAVFMATDYVTSPMTAKGQIIYGILIGMITIIIRRFGSYPEGVSFAILLMNSFVPLINRYCRPRVFGERRAAK